MVVKMSTTAGLTLSMMLDGTAPFAVPLPFPVPLPKSKRAPIDQTDADRLSGRREVHGVVEQIGQRLPNQEALAGDHRAGWHFVRGPDLSLQQLGLASHQQLFDQRRPVAALTSTPEFVTVTDILIHCIGKRPDA